MNANYPHLPTEFYDLAPNLKRVRQAALSRQTSPDAVLAVVLCRVAASIPPTVTLPNRGTLDYVAALIGQPGQGKTVAFNAARDLVPDIGTPHDGLTPGSGEGVAAAYVGTVDEQGVNPIVSRSALFTCDEGETLLTVGRRDGSTLFSTFRSAWSGSAFGSQNASRDRRRVVKSGQVRFALAVGFQPTFAADLLNDAHGGSPQRYLFAAVTHPAIVDKYVAFPEPISLSFAGTQAQLEYDVDDSILNGIRARRGAVGRCEVIPDPLESHRDLLTLKTAALLSNLIGTDAVTTELWQYATAVVDVSRKVRTRVLEQHRAALDAVRDERTRHDVERDAVKEQAREQRVLISMAGSMVKCARVKARPVTRSELAHATASKHRNVVPIDDAISFAVDPGTEHGRLKRHPDRHDLFKFVPIT